MFKIFLIPFFPLWERKLAYMMLDSNLLFNWKIYFCLIEIIYKILQNNSTKIYESLK